MTKKCNVCSRLSTWSEGEVSYCDKHKPLPTNNTKREKRSVPIDTDVKFLTHIADILSRAEVTMPYAERIRDIGRRIQNEVDKPIVLHNNLRKHSKAPAPELQEAVNYAVLNEIRNAEYSRFNAVGRLGEIYQKMDMPLPKYTYTKEGEHHKPIFICTVAIVTPNGNNYFMAQGKTKKEAKQEAATKALESYLVRNTAVLIR